MVGSLIFLQVVLLLLHLRDVNALDCSFSQRQSALAGFKCPAPSAQASAKWTRSFVEAEAWKWAPILYHHPLEKHYLMDPAVFLANTQLYDRFFTAQAARADRGEDEAPWMYWSFASVLNRSVASDMISGAGFDKEGRSLARVW